MAVGLAGQRIGQLSGGRSRVGRIQLGPRFVDVERAGKRLLGCDVVVAQPGQPPQHHVDLDLRTLGQRRRLFPQQAGQDRRGDAGQHEPAADQVLVVAAAVTHLDRLDRPRKPLRQ